MCQIIITWVMENQKFEQCSRLIAANKYERVNKSAQNWWHRLFEIMEEDAAIPEDRRFAVVRDIFPEKILSEILSMMSLTVQTKFKPETIFSSRSYSIHKIPVSIQDSSSTSSGKPVEHVPAFTMSSLQTVKGIIPEYSTTFANRTVGGDNPYMKFFKRSKVSAAIWRKQPQLPLETMPLNEKARIVTEKIAIDFVRWLKRLRKDQGAECTSEGESMDVSTVKKLFKEAFGTTASSAESHGDSRRRTQHATKPSHRSKSVFEQKKEVITEEADELDISEVMKMFEIATNNEAARSLIVSIKELPTVTKSVAKIRDLPETWSRRALHRFVRHDVKESLKKSKVVGFGKCLPAGLRYIPPNASFARKFGEYEQYNEDITTMAAVWKGIAHLRATKSYCQWLSKHSNIKRPQYLVEKNMFNPETLKRHSRESMMSFPSNKSGQFILKRKGGDQVGNM